MRNISIRTLVLLLLVSSLSGIAIGQQEIHLKTGEPEKPGINTLSTHSGESRLWIVQFRQSADSSIREALRSEGAKPLSYIPENAWITYFEGERSQLENDKDVSRVMEFSPDLKITDRAEEGEVRIFLFEELADSFQPGSLELKKVSETVYSGGLSEWEIRQIARKDTVKMISGPIPELETENDISRDLINADRVQSQPQNLTGAGFTAAAWDDGWAGEHSDLNYSGKRIVGDPNSCDDSCTVVRHATHVAGTMLGNGTIENQFRGFAPDARLVNYEWLEGDSQNHNRVAELESETDEAINEYDAVVSQNSWGYSIFGSTEGLMGNYAGESDDYDSIISGENSNVDGTISVVFSAGNEGERTPRYNTTTSAGATSKNTITVGAVDDNGHMTSYSSWGPTDDGRIKPDLVADGGASVQDFVGRIGSTIPGNGYGGLFGTSMAAPAVSGTTLLVNQEFNETYGRKPSPATVKSVLIHTAEDINRTGPDYITGWGLVNTSAATSYVNESDTRRTIRTGTVSDGENRTFEVSVESGRPSKFTLVWSDPAADSLASETLVNDLDLIVKDESGQRYYPWTLNWSIRDEKAKKNRRDERNPVEQVTVLGTESGKFNITVNGTQLPQGPQEFSLALSREVDKKPPEIAIKSPVKENYSEKPELEIKTNEALETAVYSINGRGNFSMDNTSSRAFFNSSADLVQGQNSLRFWARDLKSNWNSSRTSINYDSEPPLINPEKPARNVNISGSVDINATWSDATLDVSSAEYRIKNTTGSFLSGDLNATVVLNGITDGEYNITYLVIDDFGNVNETNRSFTLDTEKPVNTSILPEEGSFNENLGLNGSFTDSGTGIESLDFKLRNSSGIQNDSSGNFTVYPGNYRDGNYTASYLATDYARNSVEIQRELKFDTSPPIFSPQNAIDGGNISGVIELRPGISDISPISYLRYRVYNSTTNLTAWRNLDTSLDTTGLEEKEHNIEFRANDSLGNLNETNYTSIEVDNTNPGINLTEFSESERINGWILDNRTVETNCSDSGTGPRDSSVKMEGSTYIDWKKGNVSNYTITESGENTYSFQCRDWAGNTNSTELDLKIDSDKPEVVSVDPENGSETGRSFDLNLDFRDESTESGIYRSRIEASSSSGSLELETVQNNSLEISVSELEYSEEFKVKGNLVDRVGHQESFLIEYETGSNPSSGGGGGGGSGGPSKLASSTESEQETAEDSSIKVEGSTNVRDRNTAVETIEVSGDNGAEFRLENTENHGKPESTEAYSGFNLSKVSEEEAEISLEFSVNRSWFDSNRSPERTYLYRNEGANWQKLETSLKGNRSERLLFKSKIPDFSVFVIASRTPEPTCSNRTVWGLVDGSCRKLTGCTLPENAQIAPECGLVVEKKTDDRDQTLKTTTNEDGEIKSESSENIIERIIQFILELRFW